MTPSSAASIDWPTPRDDIATFGAACAISSGDRSSGGHRTCASSPPRLPPRPTPSRRCRPASPPTRRACFCGPASIPTTPRACARRRCSSPAARAAKDGFTLIEGSCFAASPAGTTNRRRLRDHARRDPGPAEGGAAARRGAARPARRHGRVRLRRRRGRHHRARARHRRRRSASSASSSIRTAT